MYQKLYDHTMECKLHSAWDWKIRYKLNKLLVGVGYPLVHRFDNENGTDPSSEVIVSLTSFNGRINTVWVTVLSLLNQTMKPKKIVLWLSKLQFPNEMNDIPQNLKRLQSRGLEIYFKDDDLKSHKKYYYAFQEYPEDYIITADDDIIYPPQHIERLWKAHLQYPEVICCHYGHIINFEEDGHITRYAKWRGGWDGYTRPALRTMGVGCNGVLYPPHSVDERIFDVSAIKQDCLSADDIWLKAMGVLKGTKTMICNEGSLVYFPVLRSQKFALYKENADANRNDDAVQNIISRYPEVEKKLFLAYQNDVSERQPRIIIAHPGKQHSLRLAEALENQGLLTAYITTMYNRKGTVTYCLSHLLSGKNKKKASGRKSDGISSQKVVVRAEITGLAGRLLDRILPSKKVYNFWNDHLNRVFARKAARYILHQRVDAVIAYDNDSDLLFEILEKKNPGILRILDVSIANRLYMKEVYEKDIRETGEKRLYEEQFNLWQEKTQNRLLKEIRLGQYFLVASEIVKKSLMFSGVKENQIKKAVYGVDLKTFEYQKRDLIHSPLRLIYVGGIYYRKGIHHLLKVVREMGDSVHLQLVGGYQDSIYNEYVNDKNVEFLGFVTHDELAQKYQAADVFVFPTLGEGFGMVVLEAMSCGLPIIITDHAGGNDAITHGKDGFEFEAGNDEQLKNNIQWFIDHPKEYAMMSQNAYEKVQRYTWEAYYQQAVDAIYDIVGK